MAQKKKQLVAEGKLDKHGRPNENTPKEYLRSLPDVAATKVGCSHCMICLIPSCERGLGLTPFTLQQATVHVQAVCWCFGATYMGWANINALIILIQQHRHTSGNGKAGLMLPLP